MSLEIEGRKWLMERGEEMEMKVKME